VADEHGPPDAEQAEQLVELIGHRLGSAWQPDAVAPSGTSPVVDDARTSRPGPLLQRPVVQPGQAGAGKEDHRGITGAAAIDEQATAGHGRKGPDWRRKHLVCAHPDQASSRLMRSGG